MSGQKDMPPEVRARIEAIKKVRSQEELARKRIATINYKIAVLSGKGGVGKSFVTASLAFALALKGYKVGVLDADVHGPSIPRMMGVSGQYLEATSDGRILPATAPLNVKVVSVGLMLPSEDTPVIWRGPLKTSAIRELLAYTDWGDIEFLLIDLPPGTGDEQLTIAQLIKDLTGTIIVTIPSEVSRSVVVKAIGFARKLGVPILGIIENMSYFECPDGSLHRIFGEGAGRRIAEEYGIAFLGEIPIDPRISEANDKGIPFFVEYPDSRASKAFLAVADKLLEIIQRSARKEENQ